MTTRRRSCRSTAAGGRSVCSMQCSGMATPDAASSEMLRGLQQRLQEDRGDGLRQDQDCRHDHGVLHAHLFWTWRRKQNFLTKTGTGRVRRSPGLSPVTSPRHGLTGRHRDFSAGQTADVSADRCGCHGSRAKLLGQPLRCVQQHAGGAQKYVAEHQQHRKWWTNDPCS